MKEDISQLISDYVKLISNTNRRIADSAARQYYDKAARLTADNKIYIDILSDLRRIIN